MVSVLGMPPADYPSAVLYGPPPPLPLPRPLQPPPLPQQPPQAGGNKFQQRSAAAFYARSPPQRSNSTAAAAAALHLRSQSVPEAVYLEQQQQQIGLPLVLQQRTSPTKQLRVMHYGLHGGHLHPPPPPPPPAAHQGSGLRRSHTNATEFAASRRRFQSGAAKLGVSYLVQQQQQRQFGSSQHLNAPPELSSFFPPPPPPMPAMPLAGHLAGFQPDPEQQPRSYIHSQPQQPRNLSRSRSNVASLRPNLLPPPPPQQQPQPFQHSRNPLYTRSTSHLFRPQDLEFPASFSATSRGCSSLQMLLLQQPLHVDCSIEYDLGKQPLIPAGSEPLLIVDPAYRDPIQLRKFYLSSG